MSEPTRAGRPTAADSIPLDQLAEELLALYAPPLKAAPTRNQLGQVLAHLMSLPGVSTVADLTPATVALYVRGMVARNLSRATIDSWLVRLGTICKHAVARGYLASNPVEPRRQWLRHGYEGRPAPEPPAAPSREEVARLLCRLREGSTTWEGHRLYALVVTVAYAGLRRNEAAELRWEHCDTAARIVRVMSSPLARRRRSIPATVADVLDGWRPFCACEWVFPGALRRGPWNGGPPGQKPIHRLRQAGQAAGIAGLTFEGLRAFWSLQLERVSLPEFEGGTDPARDYGPPVIRTGIKPPDPSRPLDLSRGVRCRPLVNGRPAGRPLTNREFNILAAMVRAGCLDGRRLTEAELDALSGHTGSARTLRELRKVEGLDRVLFFPGVNGFGGYGLRSRPVS